MTDLAPAEQAKLAEQFPDAPCPYKPAGGWIVVQERRQPDKIGAIFVSPEFQTLSKEVERVAKVAAIGPAAGCNKLGQELAGWPWIEVGDFVVLPRFSSNRESETSSEIVWRHVRVDEVLSVITDIRRALR